MRAQVRAALSAAAVALAAAASAVVPAHASPSDGWEYTQAPSVQIDESFFIHRHLTGHPGNWHQLQVYVQQDDDGVGGGLSDYRCPRGDDPTDGTCTQLAGYEFGQAADVTVTWAPRLHDVHVVGKIVLDDYVHNGDSIDSRINVRLHAAGRFSRTVTHYPATGTEPASKLVEIRRGGRITAHGHLAWLKATPTRVTHTRPLYVYWILSRTGTPT
jgi:hypothetical protein